MALRHCPNHKLPKNAQAVAGDPGLGVPMAEIFIAQSNGIGDILGVR